MTHVSTKLLAPFVIPISWTVSYVVLTLFFIVVRAGSRCCIQHDSGVSHCIHVAAIVNLHYWAPPSVRQVNVGGCQALIDACERSHAAGSLTVRSIIYTSSHGVVFNGEPIGTALRLK
jgi:nucleoside-diphosphate-sugar epimerase